MPAKAKPSLPSTTTKTRTPPRSTDVLVAALLEQGGYEVQLHQPWETDHDGQALIAALAQCGVAGPTRSTEIVCALPPQPAFQAVRAALDLPRVGGLAQNEVFAGYALGAAGLWVAHAWLKSWSGVLTEFGPVPVRYFGVPLAPMTDHDLNRQRTLLQAAAHHAAWGTSAGDVGGGKKI